MQSRYFLSLPIYANFCQFFPTPMLPKMEKATPPPPPNLRIAWHLKCTGLFLDKELSY